MTTYAQIRDNVYALTGRPDMVVETGIAIRNAVRAAHKLHAFWRDLVVISATPTDPAAQIQSIPMEQMPGFRKLAYAKYPDTDTYLCVTDVADLVTEFGAAKTNIIYGAGATLKIRAAILQPSYEIAYYQMPTFTENTSGPFASWIGEERPELIEAMAASFICGLIGEQEIRGRVDQLVSLFAADLAQDSITLN